MSQVDDFLNGKSQPSEIDSFLGTQPVKPASALRKLGDLGLSVAKGVIAVPEAAVGLADLATGGRAGKLAESAGVRFKDAKDVLSGFQSDDLKGKQQQFQQADGILDKTGVAVTNPSLIANAVAESVPSMGAGGVGARALMAAAPKLGAVGAGALGEGLVGAGSAAEQIRQQIEDGLLTGKQAALAGASGAATAAFGAAGGKVASKLGIGDVDTMIANGTTGVAQTAAQANKGMLRRGAEGFLSEGVLEELPQSLSEQILQNEALGKDWREGLDEAAVMAVLSGGAMGAGAGVLTGTQARDTAKPGEVLPAGQLGYSPDPLISFPDGTVGRQEDVDAYVAKLPEREQMSARARLMGLAPQPATPAAEVAPEVAPVVPPSVQMGINPAAGVISAVAAQAVDSGQTQEIQLSQAAEQDQAVYEQAMAEQEQQAAEQDTADKPITSGPIADAQLSEEDKRAILFSNEAVADGGRQYEGTINGDILNGMGQPFATRYGAARRANLEGKGWTIAPVFDGWVARRKDAINGATDGVSGAATGSGEQRSDQPAPSMGLGATDGAGAGSDTAGRGNDAVGEPRQSAGGTDDTAVTPLNQEITPPNVQNTTPEPAGTQAQAAPVEAGAPAPSDAAPAEAVPGAGAAPVESAGVEQTILQPEKEGQPSPVVREQLSNSEQKDNEFPARGASAKADMDHLFGVDQKRAKAIERVNAGKAWFGNAPKAGEFINKNGLKDTHEWVKTGASRFEVREKATVKESLTPQSERKTRIASALANGGHVIDSDLRDRNGLRLMSLTAEELEKIPADKVRAKPNAEAARTDSTTTKGNEDGTQTDQTVETTSKQPQERTPGQPVAESLPPTDIKVGDTVLVDGKPYKVSQGIQGGIAVESEPVGHGSGVSNTTTKFLKGDDAIRAKIEADKAGLNEQLKPDDKPSLKKTQAKRKANKAEEAKAQEAALADYFTPGNIVKSYGGHDEVLAYNAPTSLGGSWSVRVHAVEQRDGKWVRQGRPQDAREHSTQPEPRNLAAGPVVRLPYQPAAEVQYSEARGDGKPFSNAVDRGTKPTGEVLSSAQYQMRHTGARAHASGGRRVPPSYFAASSQKEWLAGWDAANAGAPVAEAKQDAPVASKPEIVVDKAEMRPYRKPDGSVGYEAVPIAEAKADMGNPVSGKAPADKAQAATETVAKLDAKSALSEREKAAKAKMFNALGKLATLAGKNTRMNWTQEEEQQLLPIVIELFDGAMELGAVSFQQAVAYVRDFISTNLDSETADAIPFDTLQGAYISVAGRHKDKAVTSKKEVVSFESLAELGATAPARAEQQGRGTLTARLSAEILSGKMPKDNPALKKLVEAFDGQPADQSRMKKAQEALEAAIVSVSRDVVAKNEGPRSTFDALLRLYESQPNLNIRTSTSIANQAYSTPAPLAFLGSKLAGVSEATTVYEPTAGNGMLTIGAKPSNVTVNELEAGRIESLKAQGFKKVLEGDALEAKVAPKSQDRVMTNPPFGSVKDSKGVATKVLVDGFKIGQIDHLIAARALETMKDDGKATLIIGANKVAGGLNTDDRIFFNWLYGNYNVTSHFEVEGDLYQRQGAGWPVRVITIGGRVKSGRASPVAGTIQRAQNWEQVYEHFAANLDANRAKSEPGAVSRPGGEGAGQADLQPVRQPAGKPNATGSDQGQAGSAVGARNVAGASAGNGADSAEQPNQQLGGADSEQRLNAESVESDRLDPAGDSVVTAPAKSAGSAGAIALSTAENQFQVTYEPRSSRKDGGVLIPVNMKDPTQDALSRLEDAVGNIDDYAVKQLGYKSVEELHGALMGLQVDSVASAIYQIEQGKGVIIADQTGIGKGRQAAAVIRWAERSGHIPVFVSVKPSLFTDMYGDLHDIGSDNINPFILNKDESIKGPGDTKLFANKAIGHKQTMERVRDSGQLPAGSNAIFMTYSQVNTDNVQRQMLTALADRAVFILDESHNAGGQSNTGEFITSLLEGAKGVTYLSATYAKRPDNMPLYFKTDIGQAAADNEGLMQAMANGGLPLQTVVSNNLVKAGQMFRRERSYDGVSIETIVDTKHRADHEALSDETTKALRAIVDADAMFHEVFVKRMNDELQQSGGAVIDNAGNQAQAGVDHTQFSSVVHNFVKQMLLGLKAQRAADDAIAALKRDEKPIIAVENTMGSFLEAYAKDNMVTQGGDLGSFDYRTVLSRALARTRVLNEVLPNGDKAKRVISLSQLDEMTRSAYEAAQAVIDGLDLSIPVSPIDWIRNEVRKAGFTIAEITGRKLAVDYSVNGKATLGSIDTLEQTDKVRTTQLFNSGRLDALILNVAGSTGISLHASEKFQDQRQRHMIIAQAAGDINIFMQMLGRVHRTGQVKLPKYSILSVDLPTEKRPTAVLSGKMKSLNANTSSNTDSATSIKTVDMFNKYGDKVVSDYLRDNYELARALDVEDLIGGDDAAEDLARKATGRLALQPIEVQHAFYEEIEAQYSAMMEYLNKTNQNDLEPRTFDYDAQETRQDVLFEGANKDSPFGEDAIYGEYSIKAQGKAMTPAEIREAMAENLSGQRPDTHVESLISGLLEQWAKKFNEDRAKHGLVPGAFNADKYRTFVTGIYGKDSAEAFVQSALAKIAKGEEIENITPARLSNSADAMKGITFMRSHAVGNTFRVDINGDMFNAVVTNIRSTHKVNGNPFSLSKIQVTLALNGALRSITVPATQFQRIEVSSIGRGYTVEQLFKEQPANQRETAKIVTGNLLAAYGELTGVRGTIIAFTKQDGTTEQGILLPKTFDFKSNTRGDYRLPTAQAAFTFLQKSENKDIGRFGIQSRDGVVRVLPAGNGVSVLVPKSKLKGGKYFLDKGLIEALGDFVTSGSAMKATTYVRDKAVQALDLLMKKNALYAIPSMAEEAKDLTEDDAPTFSRTRGTDQTESAAFKAWFGDSKVIDADGKPLVVYHGSEGSISIFDNQKYRIGEKAGFDKAGIYFTPSARLANYYGTTLNEVFLKIQNPLRLPSDKFPKLISSGLTRSDVKEIQSAGFDGVISSLGGEIIVFSPEQIKSATGNNGEFSPANPDIRFARTRPTFSRGAQVQANESVETVAMAIASKWENTPEIVVAFDMNDPIIPEAVRKEDQRQRSGGATGTPEGFYYKGQVYLMSSKLGTANDIARVLFHETLGHYGLRSHFGKEMGTILRDVATLRRAEVDAKIKQYGLKGINLSDRLVAAEEVLAELAQTRPEIGFVKRAIAAVRTWLRQNVPGFASLRLSDAELIRNYILPARQFVENGGGPKGGVRVEPTFSRGKNDAMTNSNVVGNTQGGRSADDTTPGDLLRKLEGTQVVDSNGAPLLVYHGSKSQIDRFDASKTIDGGLHFGSKSQASMRSSKILHPAYLYAENIRRSKDTGGDWKAKIASAKAAGYDGIVYLNRYEGVSKETVFRLHSQGLSEKLDRMSDAEFRRAVPEAEDSYIVFDAKQVIQPNESTAPDSGGAMFSRTLGETVATAANNIHDVSLPAGYVVGDFFKSAPGKLSWWHKTVGTMYDLAQRSPEFKRVFDGVQNFINDVSYYATEAADLAPNILPKLESWKDITKSPLSPEDTKAISTPIFEGTLTWARDESGKPIEVATLEAQAKSLTPEQKAQRLLRNDKVDANVLKMWQGLPVEQFEAIIEGKYERDMLKAGIVWTPAELRTKFNLTDKQIGLYQEFRKAADKSLTNLAISDMLRFGGKDTAPIRERVLAAANVVQAGDMLRDYLMKLSDTNLDRKDVLLDTANKMVEKSEKAKDLIERGYAPLSRYGQYTLDVVSQDGERVYFGMFESKIDAARMARQLEQEYPGATMTRGTVSEEEYKLFAGVSPETLELFGDMLGLEAQGDGAAAKAFQTYLKLAKSNRSSMKRMIQRKGIAGFSEDSGRVLAGFVYSNARQTASNLHMGEMTEAANEVSKKDGELKDQAVRLVDYVKNPREEAQAFRGLLFAQYIGGSIASAMVNMTQPLTMTFPWLSQYGTVSDAAKQMTAAMRDANKSQTGDARLDAALKRAEEDGTVSPQEVHQLMQQSQGRGALQSGDGTRAGNALAAGNNFLSRVSLGWGKLFGLAEQFNRRATFIAAYRMAVANGMKDPDAFARKAIAETQGVYNKGNKPNWARGAVGSTLFTFKQYSIAYMEMLHRMYKSSPEGKKAALLALAVLFLMSGAGGLPGSDDLDDLISGLLQRMGYNFDTKAKRKEFFASLVGEGGAQFLETGISGLPGMPLDVSGRLGMGNLIPGTGVFQKKADYTRDVLEIAGPGGDFVKRGFDAAGKVIEGDVLGLNGAVRTIAPKAVQNLYQSYDMASMGMYRDAKGMKVLDTDGYDATLKAIGFQPNDVKKVQDASFEAQRMIGLNRLRESEIANRWALGIFEKDSDKVRAAREELREWNETNPASPIRINFKQILQRVQKMNQTKAERIAATAPKEIRNDVRNSLATE